mmetsp:Transcript_108265/g.316680  ORF Transcript_108265/g.316680 Transcript_108265/m.316680 type:complete len:251 (-) Transcript_108265:220-972(-)
MIGDSLSFALLKQLLTRLAIAIPVQFGNVAVQREVSVEPCLRLLVRGKVFAALRISRPPLGPQGRHHRGWGVCFGGAADGAGLPQTSARRRGLPFQVGEEAVVADVRGHLHAPRDSLLHQLRIHEHVVLRAVEVDELPAVPVRRPDVKLYADLGALRQKLLRQRGRLRPVTVRGCSSLLLGRHGLRGVDPNQSTTAELCELHRVAIDHVHYLVVAALRRVAGTRHQPEHACQHQRRRTQSLPPGRHRRRS